MNRHLHWIALAALAGLRVATVHASSCHSIKDPDPRKQCLAGTE